MSAVGISFGSPTSGTGFDVGTTVSSIVANLQAVETPWKSQLTAIQSQDSALTSIGTGLSTLGSAVQALTDFDGVLATKEGSSSDTNVLTLSSAGATASAGSHTVVVSRLAQTSSEQSGSIAASDTLSGSLTFQVGSGTAQTVPVVAGSSNTLATYAAAINSAGIGVSASVISDTSGSRLSLVSQTSGAAGQLAITGSGLTDVTTGSALPVNTGLAGQDALLTVDGSSVDSASNTVSTAIPGVTFQLLSSSPSTQVQIQIANDNTDVESAFSTFVSAYNSVVGGLKTQEGNDSSGSPEPLYGNPVVSQIQSALSLALTSGADSGSIGSLSQLGISVNDDGTLSLDASTLDATLNSNYSDVVGFLQNTGSFGQNFSNTLDSVGSQTPTGAITLQLAAYSSQETTLNDDVSSENTLIATDQANLTTELNAANETLQSIPQQLNEINELYSAMTGYDNNASG